jgi:hypothetical protein
MMRRAVYLVQQCGVPPQQILMLTFSVKAAKEIRDRLKQAFCNPLELPVAKTFHALAFAWVNMHWKRCSLGSAPSLLTTDAARRGLMERVIVRWMWDERLGRCVKWLRLPPGALWSNVAEAIRTTEPAIFAELQAAASDDVPHYNPPEPSNPRRSGRDASDVAKEQNLRRERQEAFERAREEALQFHCYFHLRLRSSRQVAPSAASSAASGKRMDDLDTQFGSKKLKKKATDLLEVVKRVRIQGHSYAEYPAPDGELCQRYEETQRREGLTRSLWSSTSFSATAKSLCTFATHLQTLLWTSFRIAAICRNGCYKSLWTLHNRGSLLLATRTNAFMAFVMRSRATSAD